MSAGVIFEKVSIVLNWPRKRKDLWLLRAVVVRALKARFE
jgi:hypothetical protein